MRIVIDLQSIQGSSQHRGIGRYSYELVKAMIKQNTTHEIMIVFNGIFMGESDTLLTEFSQLIDKKYIYVWYAVPPVAYQTADTDHRKIAEILREAFIAKLQPDIVLIMSLFEGNIDHTVTSIGQFNRQLTAVILYDLIPLLSPERHLYIPKVKDWYDEKIKYLKAADCLLAISDSARNEAITHLQISPEKVSSIHSAASQLFIKSAYSSEQKQAFLSKYQLDQPFILYAGGVDERKDVQTLIHAYDQLPETLKQTFKLVIICGNNIHAKQTLESLINQCSAKKQMMTLGYVTDEDLVTFYNLCHLFVFPSLHEGFGLTVLEAMSCGAPVLVSNASSLPEVVDQYQDALFMAGNPRDLSIKMTAILQNEALRQQLIAVALKRAQHYSWDKVATAAISAIEQRVQEYSQINDHCFSEENVLKNVVQYLPKEKVNEDYLICVADCLSKNFIYKNI